MKLLNRIKENRGRLDITQEQLAKKAGVSRETVGRIENGKNADLITAMDLADALGVSLIDLFYREN
jgi:DNA-binding XRE family transcriptional regulator